MNPRSFVLPVAALIGAAAVAGCSSSGGSHAAGPSSVPGTASGRIGDLRITDAYIPKPASPAVAAAYLTITDTGATADQLTSVTSSVTGSVMPMTEVTDGNVGTMAQIKSVDIPAHGRFVFRQGDNHLMMSNPSRVLTVGDTVTLTLVFAHAGTLGLQVPVVPITGPTATTPSGSQMSGSMNGMPGMSG